MIYQVIVHDTRKLSTILIYNTVISLLYVGGYIFCLKAIAYKATDINGLINMLDNLQNDDKQGMYIPATIAIAIFVAIKNMNTQVKKLVKQYNSQIIVPNINKQQYYHIHRTLLFSANKKEDIADIRFRFIKYTEAATALFDNIIKCIFILQKFAAVFIIKSLMSKISEKYNISMSPVNIILPVMLIIIAPLLISIMQPIMIRKFNNYNIFKNSRMFGRYEAMQTDSIDESVLFRIFMHVFTSNSKMLGIIVAVLMFVSCQFQDLIILSVVFQNDFTCLTDAINNIWCMRQCGCLPIKYKGVKDIGNAGYIIYNNMKVEYKNDKGGPYHKFNYDEVGRDLIIAFDMATENADLTLNEMLVLTKSNINIYYIKCQLIKLGLYNPTDYSNDLSGNIWLTNKHLPREQRDAIMRIIYSNIKNKQIICVNPISYKFDSSNTVYTGEKLQ